MPCAATSYICDSTKAEREVVSITIAAKGFYLDYRVYPASTSWLTDLASPSNSQVNVGRIQYLAADSTFADPWGTPYHYRAPGKRNTNGVDVWSAGKDRKSLSDGDDADDINNWNTNRPWSMARAYQWEYCNSWLMRNSTLVATLGLLGLGLLMAIMRRARTRPSSVFRTRGTPPAGQESRRSPKSADG